MLLYLGGTAIGVLQARLLTPQAWAQIAFDQIAPGLAEDRKLAEARLQELQHAPLPLTDDYAQETANYDYETRLREATDVAATVTPDVLLTMSYEDVQQVVLADYRYLAEVMYAANVSPLPDPADIIPVPYLPLPAPPPDAPKESKFTVLIDILLDALGLFSAKELFTEALSQLPGIDEQTGEIEAAIQSRNSERITDALWGFGGWFFREEIIRQVLAFLTKRGPEVAARLLRQLSARCVPVIGWVWTLIAFGLAINRHWNRLVA